MNGVTLGGAGALAGGNDSNPSASFDGSNDAASAALNLSGTSKLTVEFWLKWTLRQQRRSRLRVHPQLEQHQRRLLHQPQLSAPRSAASGSGSAARRSRNNAYFNRPSANAWHHYAIVFDSTATASQQVIPYVDGAAVSYVKLNSGTGAGNFANSTLYFMSRNASSLFGNGSLDEVALYNRALTAAEISAHFKAANP